MRVDLPGQMELPVRIAHSAKPSPTGSKEELGISLARLLYKYDSKPSSELWIEIQATAKEILK